MGYTSTVHQDGPVQVSQLFDDMEAQREVKMEGMVRISRDLSFSDFSGIRQSAEEVFTTERIDRLQNQNTVSSQQRFVTHSDVLRCQQSRVHRRHAERVRCSTKIHLKDSRESV